MAALVQRAARKPAPSDAPTPAEAAGSVRVIERTVRILKCLSASGGLTLTELSRDIDLHKATVLRFLRTLERGGLVSLAGGKVWRLGPAFLEMRLRALGQLDLRTVARPFMEAASRACNETVQLATLADHAVLYLEKVEPPDQVLRINSQVGSRRPIHCTALGKLMAAFSEPAEVERILCAAGMARYTERTITSAPAFAAELARIRRRGYAVDDREFNELVVCAAAPVRDASGKVAAGLSVSTYGIPVKGPRFRELVEVAVDTAARISAALGWPGGQPAGPGA